MKFCILSQIYYPEMGAAAARLFELSKGFAARGWDVSVISAMPNYPTGRIWERYRKKFITEEKIDGIKIKRFWIYASKSNKKIPRILSMMSFAFTSLFSLRFLMKEKPDYLLVESPPLLLGLTGIILKKLTGIKCIMNIADIWPLSAKELKAIEPGLFYNQIERLEKFIYKHSDICVGQSNEIVQHLVNKGAAEVKLFRNGVDLYRFDNVKNGKGSVNLRIIYAGLIGVAQGLLPICKEIDFKKLGTELHIYGEGAEKESLKQFIEENPDKSIYLHESVDRENIPKLLQQYDAALIPLVHSIYGAVPSKIYESMAAGLPILYSGNGEAASIIKEHSVGWSSDSGDFSKLTENITEFIELKEKRNAFHLNGISAATNVFNRKTQIDDLHKYLSDILTKKTNIN